MKAENWAKRGPLLSHGLRVAEEKIWRLREANARFRATIHSLSVRLAARNTKIKRLEAKLADRETLKRVAFEIARVKLKPAISDRQRKRIAEVNARLGFKE